MSEPFGISGSSNPALKGVAPAAAAPAVELLNPPSTLSTAATFIATVLQRKPDGTVLFRSPYGTLTLRTSQALAPGARVEVRFAPGTPPVVTLFALDNSEPVEAEAPPMRLDLGTTLTATLVSDGTRFTLRVGTPSPNASLLGQIAVAASGETLIESEIGTMVLDRRLTLAPGTTIAFERLGSTAPGTTLLPPTQGGGWPTLDQALAILGSAAPELAQQLRAELAPGSAADLAGTLLFLLGALYGGRWPGEKVDRALSGAGQERLKERLGQDLDELGQLRGDNATGTWRVLVLPLLAGASVQPLRLYVRRRSANDKPEDRIRFVIEAELTHLGTLQFDGLVRGQRFDLALRSHVPLADTLRREWTGIFRHGCAAAGFHGDIMFTTAGAFDVAPLAPLRSSIELRI